MKISFSGKTDLKNSEPLSSADEVLTPTKRSGAGSLELVDIDDYYADELGGLLVLVSHMTGTYNANDSSGPRYEAYIRLEEDSFDIATGELIKETVGFKVDRERHYRST